MGLAIRRQAHSHQCNSVCAKDRPHAKHFAFCNFPKDSVSEDNGETEARPRWGSAWFMQLRFEPVCLKLPLLRVTRGHTPRLWEALCVPGFQVAPRPAPLRAGIQT